MNQLNLQTNADAIAFESAVEDISNFERAIEEARHYILMDTDTFAVRVGDIEIRRKK